MPGAATRPSTSAHIAPPADHCSRDRSHCPTLRQTALPAARARRAPPHSRQQQSTERHPPHMSMQSPPHPARSRPLGSPPLAAGALESPAAAAAAALLASEGSAASASSSASAVQHTDKIKRIGDWILGETLGQGSFGKVSTHGGGRGASRAHAAERVCLSQEAHVLLLLVFSLSLRR